MNIAQIISGLIEQRENAQIAHWQTTSYSEHKAIGKFYDELSDLMDLFFETYSGKYQRPVIGGLMNISKRESTLIVDEVFRLAQNAEYEVSKDTDLLNIIADIKGLCNHTKYLLTLK